MRGLRPELQLAADPTSHPAPLSPHAAGTQQHMAHEVARAMLTPKFLATVTACVVDCYVRFAVSPLPEVSTAQSMLDNARICSLEC